jgi:hypothetical protein
MTRVQGQVATYINTQASVCPTANNCFRQRKCTQSATAENHYGNTWGGANYCELAVPTMPHATSTVLLKTSSSSTTESQSLPYPFYPNLENEKSTVNTSNIEIVFRNRPPPPGSASPIARIYGHVYRKSIRRSLLAPATTVCRQLSASIPVEQWTKNPTPAPAAPTVSHVGSENGSACERIARSSPGIGCHEYVELDEGRNIPATATAPADCRSQRRLGSNPASSPPMGGQADATAISTGEITGSVPAFTVVREFAAAADVASAAIAAEADEEAAAEAAASAASTSDAADASAPAPAAADSSSSSPASCRRRMRRLGSASPDAGGQVNALRRAGASGWRPGKAAVSDGSRDANAAADDAAAANTSGSVGCCDSRVGVGGRAADFEKGGGGGGGGGGEGADVRARVGGWGRDADSAAAAAAAAARRLARLGGSLTDLRRHRPGTSQAEEEEAVAAAAASTAAAMAAAEAAEARRRRSARTLLSRAARALARSLRCVAPGATFAT